MNTLDRYTQAPERTGTGTPEAGNRNPQPGVVNMGAALLLAVFLVITLVVFALLALSGAKNDLEFSRQLADQKTAYYEACSRSEALLSRVDGEVRRARAQGREPELADLPVTVTAEGICWELPVDENRTLQAVYSPETGEVTQWKVVPRENWTDEQPIWNP